MTLTIRRFFLCSLLMLGLAHPYYLFANTDIASKQKFYPLFTPDNIKWLDASAALAGDVKIASLINNPHKKIYIARLKLPVNYQAKPHQYTTAQYLTVLSGTLYLGQGDTLNEQASRALPAGSFVMLPAGMHFYFWTKEETILQISSKSPIINNSKNNNNACF